MLPTGSIGKQTIPDHTSAIKAIMAIHWAYIEYCLDFNSSCSPIIDQFQVKIFKDCENLKQDKSYCDAFSF